MTWYQHNRLRHTHNWQLDSETNDLVCLHCGKVKGKRPEKEPGKNKYNSKTCWYNGFMYDSIAEANYAQELDLRKKAKDIKDWERQVTIPILAPKTGDKICALRVDFRILHNDKSYELAEIKGYPTPEYRLKRKLLEMIWLPDHPDHIYTVIMVKGRPTIKIK